MKLKPSIRYVAILAVLCLLGVAVSGCTSISSGGYEFTAGVTPPKAVSDLMKNGTVVVMYFWKSNCPDCDKAKPKLVDLESQYKGTNVTFALMKVDDNSTANQIAHVYGVTATPTLIVLRGDGANARWVSDFDTSTVKSAIADAQKWK